MARWRVLHAIHDFLPRHRAGSEIYAYDLASALAARHDVWVLSAEYDPSANHGALRWRTEGTLPVIEIVNNWEFRSFDESYASARLNDRITHVLDAVRPDIVHVHNLLNLSLDLPRLARGRGVPTVATLHDYTMVCISGGQRVHRDELAVRSTVDGGSHRRGDTREAAAEGRRRSAAAGAGARDLPWKSRGARINRTV